VTGISGDTAIAGSVEEIKNQNQRLLREHHKLMSRISELENKLNTERVHILLRDGKRSINICWKKDKIRLTKPSRAITHEKRSEEIGRISNGSKKGNQSSWRQ